MFRLFSITSDEAYNCPAPLASYAKLTRQYYSLFAEIFTKLRFSYISCNFLVTIFNTYF